MAHFAVAPTMVYPLFETALRARRRADASTSTNGTSASCGRGSRRSRRSNPHAWSRTAYSPEEIRTVTPDNRMVCFPYPKRMCANIDVDQARRVAPVLVRSRARRRRPRRPHGVPARGGRGARPLLLHRARTRSPSRRRSPSPVGDALAAAGIGARRRRPLRPLLVLPVGGARSRPRCIGHRRRRSGPLTVTGGLGFAGGPVNNYPTHAIARMVEVLRADPERLRVHDRARLVHHEARGRRLVGTTAGARLPARRHVDEPGRASTRARAASRPGSSTARSTIEATSVAVERDGTPSLGIVTALTADGRRAIANTRDADLARARSPRKRRKARRCGSPTTARRIRWRDATRRVRGMMWRGLHASLRPLRQREAVPPLVHDGARLPALRPALRTRSRATGPARWRSTSILVGGVFAVVFVIAIGADDPRRSGRPAARGLRADHGDRAADRVPVLEDDLGRGRPRVPAAARRQRATRRTGPPHLSATCSGGRRSTVRVRTPSTNVHAASPTIAKSWKSSCACSMNRCRSGAGDRRQRPVLARPRRARGTARASRRRRADRLPRFRSRCTTASQRAPRAHAGGRRGRRARSRRRSRASARARRSRRPGAARARTRARRRATSHSRALSSNVLERLESRSVPTTSASRGS